MRIYFCDLCNESVPQGDLDHGLAVIRKGRVVCLRCERAMSHGPEPPAGAHLAAGAAPAAGEAAPAGGLPAPGGLVHDAPPPPPTSVAPVAHQPLVHRRSRPRSGVGLALGVSGLALIGVVGSAAYLYRELEQSRARLGELRDDVALEQAGLLEEHDQRFERRNAALAEQLDAQRTEAQLLVARLEEATRHQSEALGALRAELAGLEERLRSTEGSAADLARHEREISKVADTVAGLHGEVLRLAERLAEAQTSEPPPPLEVAPPGEAAKPVWWSLVGDLASQSSGARWQAVQALGDTRDPAVAEHLAPMLQDPDIFVRMATARILGDLKAVLGIPALIDGLEDPEPSVREAAFVSLRAVTGRDLRFEPDAKEAERAKQVKAWRDWWKHAEQELLGGRTPVKSAQGR